MVTKVFIVEDDKEMAATEARYLEIAGMASETFHDLASFREALVKGNPDVIILNPALPDGDGFLFLKRFREKNDTPVIITSDRNIESDRIMGFELGCDDFLVSPFSLKELVLRIGAILRRMDSTKREGSVVSYKSGNELMILDSSSHRMSLEGGRIDLTSAEWRILYFLCVNCNSIISRQQIMERCFEYTSESYDRVVDTHIKNIRAKMGRSGKNWIETIRGYGYRFTGSVVHG